MGFCVGLGTFLVVVGAVRLPFTYCLVPVPSGPARKRVPPRGVFVVTTVVVMLSSSLSAVVRGPVEKPNAIKPVSPH